MCSGCSGDAEEPPEALPAPTAAEDDPFWAWWKAGEETEDAGNEQSGNEEAGKAPLPAGTL